MPLRPLQLRHFTLRKSHLAQLTDAERNLFFLSGHILNELNSLNKVFSWCLKNEANCASATINLAQGVQSMIYARILAGKLSEAWEALRGTLFASKPSASLGDGLHPDSQIALSNLKKYFSHSNLISNIRNSFAFHYSKKLGESWEELSEEDSLQVVLGGTIGNNINLAAELATNAALIKAAQAINLEAGLKVFLNEVQSITNQFTTFLEGIELFYLKRMLGDDLATKCDILEIMVNQSFSEVRIPYFCTPDEMLDP